MHSAMGGIFAPPDSLLLRRVQCLHVVVCGPLVCVLADGTQVRIGIFSQACIDARASLCIARLVHLRARCLAFDVRFDAAVCAHYER